MKTPEELLNAVRTLWHAHPDDYDPTDEQMWDFIRVVQRDAIESAAQWCLDADHDSASWFEDRVLKLLPADSVIPPRTG